MKRCTSPAPWKPPNSCASIRAHGASLKSSGIPVAARPRNVVMMTTCSARVFASKRLKCSGAGSGARGVSRAGTGAVRLAAGIIARLLPAAIEPQRAVQAEEAEAARNERPVERVGGPQHFAAVVVARIRMRIVGDEALVRAGVAARARLDQTRLRHRRRGVA